MKRIAVSLFLALSVCLSSFSQEMLTKAEAIQRSFPDSVKYVLPAFDKGRIIYSNGEFSAGKFNIDSHCQKILFLDETGSVKQLDNDSDVSKIYIGNSVFYRTGGRFITFIGEYGDVYFMAAKVLEIKDREKKGAFGMTSETTNITQYGTMYSGGQIYDLEQFSQIKYSVRFYPYLNIGGRFYPMTKKKLMKTFPEKKDAIEEYFSKNVVDLGKQEDVNALIAFIKE